MGKTIMVEPKTWWIYALIEPRPEHERFGEVRYVGKGFDPDGRLKEHLRTARRRKTRKERWLYAVVQAGFIPSIELLEHGIGAKAWQAVERKWIASYRELGHDLTNATDGGDGACGWVHTSEWRTKRSAEQKGRTITWGDKISAAKKGKSGKSPTPEVRAKLSKALRRNDLRGKRFGELTAIAPLLKDGRWVCKCDCGAITTAATNLLTIGGKKTCGDRSEHPTGKPCSAETRAKLSAAQKAHHARRRSEEK